MSATIWGGVPGTVVIVGNAVGTIANLRAISSANAISAGTDIVFVAGYTSKGDGGGGNYYLDTTDTTSADNGGSVIVSADGGRWKLLITSYMSPKQFGCKGDGATDDTTNFQKFLSALPTRGVGNLAGGNYRLTQPCALVNQEIILSDGKIFVDNATLQFFYAVTARNKCKFYNIWFIGNGATGSTGVPKYYGGIFAGNQDYPAPMNVASANDVTVEDCRFENLTSCVFAGDKTGAAVPYGWNVKNNKFINVVGLAGESEGYGVLFSPANNSFASNNYFENVRRHAVYIAAEASFNTVAENIINGCDNIAIQSNTFVTTGYADGNKIINNEIRGLTRSIAYGYRSSIGIGLYGKWSNYIVTGNRIFNALDTGIEASGAISGSAYAAGLVCENNFVVMDATATDSGIRITDVQGFTAQGNKVKLNGAIYGMVVDCSSTADTAALGLFENDIETTNAGAFAFRVNITVARTLKIYRNSLHGFQNLYANVFLNTSTAGNIFTDLNHRVGVVNSDADFSVNVDGLAVNTDASNILHTGTLTAVRTITLAENAIELGRGRDAEVTISRTGAGAFNLNVKSTTGGTLKALTTGQWAKFKKNDSGVWVLVSFGSL